ncbi:MAG: ABC transporter substrate-binding protein [Burkholderiales bacterium]|jgi:branched-chain amino acid transport system substrate-binding protein|nr:ABC transporter substrate-binding protein [Burkholderiales bacterium]MCA3214242.1 ABC transporter substrate-binding protein [Burkholderiales bacterium]MCA3225209.1 ABC transporter substrate-binding protein [Burkholderiales bacterium]MCE2645317.1 ABC transporter substrate-binding protein [Burkholderiaceae bacterium]
MKRTLLSTLVAAACALGLPAAQSQVSDNVVRIGVLTDMSSLYTDLAGRGSEVAARMAVEDFGAQKKGLRVEIVSADHQNKADVGSNIARQWYDVDKVDVIVDVPNSGVALAVNQITRDKGKAFLVSGAASADLTGKACSPNTIHWTYDTWMLANGTGEAIVKTGGDSWFFLTADYAFGHALERDTEAVVARNGGRVVGKVRHPLNTQDFSSFLLQAQSSRAKIIGLANAGGDTTNSIKQAAEFGIVKGGQNLAGLLVFLTDVHALGLPTAQGLILTETFYWDMNDQTRAFARRFAAANRGIHPTMVHAGVYSSVLHYLKAVEAAKTDDGSRIIAQMKSMPTEDPLFGKGSIRADGRKIHPAYLMEVKRPAESKGAWDYHRLRATIPAERAFRPLADGGCPLAGAGEAKK